MQVWKFPIPYEDQFSIEMPHQAELLYVGTQGEAGQLWARVHPSSAKEDRHFCLRGTGHDLEGCGKYVGSFIVNGGGLVFHLFEIK